VWRYAPMRIFKNAMCLYCIVFTGKSALANAIMGKEFVETESTVGISCTVQRAVIGQDKGNWICHDAPDKELEAAVASMVKNGTGTKAEEDETENDDTATVSTISTSGTCSSAPASTLADGTPLCIRTSTQGSADTVIRQEAVDNEVVMRYLGDERLMASKYIISLFDFGGQSVFNVRNDLLIS
jgi:hypothetical protein